MKLGFWRGICCRIGILLLAVLAFFPVALQAQDQKTDLTLYVVGAYPGDLTPEKANSFYIEVRNNGNTAVTGIHFNVNAPEDWIINFNPASLESLGVGSSNTVEVTIIPVNHSDSRDYNLTVVAQANETSAATSLYLRVQGGSSLWLWVGIGLAVVVIAVFILIFLRQGRR